MAAAAILKIAFLAITHEPIVRYQRNFALKSRTTWRQRPCDKNCKFLKSKMADGRHFENYLSSKLSHFDEICHTVADIGPDYSHVTQN